MSRPNPAQRPHPAATFRALRHRNFRLFFFGQLVSLVGTWMQTIAQQWLVYRLTGSATMLGLVSLAGLIPLVPMSLWGGSLADRFAKRRIVLVAQTVMMLLAFVLAALTWTGTVEVWHVLVLAVALGAANAVDIPARQAFIVEMVEGKQDLTSAIGLNSTIFNAARAVGPAVAGIAVATTGEAGAFFINGVTFLAVIASLFLMRDLPENPPPTRTVRLGAHLGEAVGYVRSQQAVLVLLSLVAVSAFLSMPYTTLLPVFAQDVLRESAQPLIDFLSTSGWFTFQDPDALIYGLLMAATGVGAVVGALAVASLPANARRGRWLTLCNLGFPALVVGVALSQSFALTLVLLVGVTYVTQNALANTMIQLAVPDALRGRVMSFYSLTFQFMMRLGGMQAGVMGDAVGAPLTVGLGAALCLAYGAFVAWRYPHVRNMA
ncbi:MAG: MFS transporter [Chloroflexi bacterium]|nr:MFS transporter [Chloroflexota bacterium]